MIANIRWKYKNQYSSSLKLKRRGAQAYNLDSRIDSDYYYYYYLFKTDYICCWVRYTLGKLEGPVRVNAYEVYDYPRPVNFWFKLCNDWTNVIDLYKYANLAGPVKRIDFPNRYTFWRPGFEDFKSAKLSSFCCLILNDRWKRDKVYFQTGRHT